MASSATTASAPMVNQNEFIQLMVAQLKAQDPMSPTDNGQMLAQLAQFSTLSGVQQLNTSFGDMLKLQEITQGSGLIGKTVSYADSSGSPKSGTVESVGLTNGAIALQVGSDSVSLDQISGVAATT